MGRWKVIQHDSVSEFLSSLPKKDEVKVSRSLKLLEEFGVQLRKPHAASIPDVRGLWELKTIFAGKHYRILYFRDGNIFVAVHGILKDRPKIPRKDLEIAQRRMREYFEEKKK